MPTNGTAITGFTSIGVSVKWANPVAVTAADEFVPFTVQGIVTGLTLNTAYAFDVAAQSFTTPSAAGLQNVNFSLVEIA